MQSHQIVALNFTLRSHLDEVEATLKTKYDAIVSFDNVNYLIITNQAQQRVIGCRANWGGLGTILGLMALFDFRGNIYGP